MKSSLLLINIINDTAFYIIVFLPILQEFIEFGQPLMYDKTINWKQNSIKEYLENRYEQSVL
ncbi:hypothetical protein DWV46_06495 [Sellimonas intestinalis]|jgi:hypothetical protein|uniref:Uncharacterized protein n=1 Tax=Sellimonas intestinalis TaxID=1653434 RepID=A0A3E3K430_9FIRM|nr:hypothetical protein AXF09_02470 [Ruminococcus sp. DSM 100440]PWM94057.1 MAG: hypothetical protein DBY12_00380 [Ruminococcus sp.]RGD38252.1 hypothetical protein DW166_04195 [Sellimonas intestinalis]RGE61394.1 hypothetical protein DWV46_06495 [Sellimonas intestinalis]RGE88287.1 hypothetical protein DW008_04445 [Sellimonas intestinalis]